MRKCRGRMDYRSGKLRLGTGEYYGCNGTKPDISSGRQQHWFLAQFVLQRRDWTHVPNYESHAWSRVPSNRECSTFWSTRLFELPHRKLTTIWQRPRRAKYLKRTRLA